MWAVIGGLTFDVALVMLEVEGNDDIREGGNPVRLYHESTESRLARKGEACQDRQSCGIPTLITG